MTYFTKPLHSGYNAYIDATKDDQGTQMDVGLIVLEENETFSYENDEKEAAFLLFAGDCLLEWNGKSVRAGRSDCFRQGAYCLLTPRKTAVTIRALAHTEIYFQATENDRDYESVLYTPETVQVQHAGANGELMGAMRREIKTFFDYDNAPFSNMVLGEVLNFPGKWSSYPPHHHPQPEVYFYRFDHPQGFGAGFANGEIYKTGHNGLAVINHGFHSQTAAPGYAMCYAWGIRHLDGDPWKKTRIDDEEHAWLWKADANEHIFQG